MSMNSPKRIAVMTMCHNEGDMLSLWVRHYGRQVGFDRLYILDHGSTDGSTGAVGGNIIRLPRDVFDDHARAETVSAFQRGLLKFHDVVIYTDTDEFLVHDPAVHASFADFAETLEVPVSAAIGIDVVHRPSSEPAIDFSRPILAQREFGIFKGAGSKPIMVTEPLEWAAGFHASTREPVFRTDAILFHLKTVDHARALKRLELTRSMAWSEAAITIGMGGHQRLDDETFNKWFFEHRESDIDKGVLDEFDPEAWVGRMRDGLYERKGFIRYEQAGLTGAPISSRALRIPARFREGGLL